MSNSVNGGSVGISEYRVCDLKASQITMRRNNDDLGLFLYSTFKFALDSEGGNGFLSDKVLL